MPPGRRRYKNGRHEKMEAKERKSSAEEQQSGLFQSFGYPAQEAGRVSAVDEPMIVGEGKGQDFARLEGAVAVASDLPWFHAEARDAQDRHFGILHDGRKSRPADAAHIRNRENAAGHFLDP